MNDDDVASLVRDVWSAVVDIDLGVRSGRSRERVLGDPVAARVAITGAWNGTVTVAVPGALAEVVAATMFGLATDDLTAVDIDDALCELTNMIGGGVKALLPGPSQLSLPSVAGLVARADAAAEAGDDGAAGAACGDAARVQAEGRSATRLWFMDEAGRPVVVTVLAADLALGVRAGVAGADTGGAS